MRKTKPFTEEDRKKRLEWKQHGEPRLRLRLSLVCLAVTLVTLLLFTANVIMEYVL